MCISVERVRVLCLLWGCVCYGVACVVTCGLWIFCVSWFGFRILSCGWFYLISLVFVSHEVVFVFVCVS